MNGRLRAYDGVLNGVDVVHGLVVVRSSASQRPADIRAASARQLSPEFEDVPDGSTLESIVQRAAAVIGTREEATRWLGTPVRALNYATPISLLVDDAGADQVLAVLENLENGVL